MLYGKADGNPETVHENVLKNLSTYSFAMPLLAPFFNTLFIIFLFSMLTYPNAIGGKLDLNAYSAAPSMALAIELISICGAAFLAFALYYFVRINYSKSY